MRCRAVDGGVVGLIGRRVDSQAGSGRPDFGLVEVGDPARECNLLVGRTGKLQTAQHATLTRLLPGFVSRPEQADAEAAVRVEPRAEVALHRGLALFLADLLDPGGGRRWCIRPVLRSRIGPHIDRLGHFEPVIAGAVDDHSGVRRVIRPVQATARPGVGERGIGRRPQCLGRGEAAQRALVAGRQGSDDPGDQQCAQRGQHEDTAS